MNPELQNQPENAEDAGGFQARRAFDLDGLTRALRVAGAALVVASASTFMLQHWGGGNDMTRYAMLVGQSLLLAAAAYFVGLTLREGRSARTFLALVLATMPVSFAVLGGLVYSQFHLESVPVLPSYATWIAPSKLAAALAVLGTLCVLVPLGGVSFVALARREAKPLTIAFFLANLLVLVPVRQPLAIVVLAGATALALLRLELVRFSGRPQLDNIEGKLARVMPFAAPVIMLGRVVHLYHVGAGFIGAVSLLAAAIGWLFLGRQPLARRDLGAWGVTGLALPGWILCWAELYGEYRMGTDVATLLLGLPLALCCVIASQRAVKAKQNLIGVATLVGLLTAILASALDQGSIAAIACIVVGVGVGVWGASLRAVYRTIGGTLTALYGLGVQVWLATHHDNVLRWASLSVVGVLLIVGSAYLERHRAAVLRLWERGAAQRLSHENG